MDAAPIGRLDLARFSTNLGRNRKVIAEILHVFLHAADETLTKLQWALEERSMISWLQLLHQLKGAALNITARRLASLCSEAELIHQLPHPHAEAMLYHLHKEFAFLRGEITAYLSCDQG